MESVKFDPWKFGVEVYARSRARMSRPFNITELKQIVATAIRERKQIELLRSTLLG